MSTCKAEYVLRLNLWNKSNQDVTWNIRKSNQIIRISDMYYRHVSPFSLVLTISKSKYFLTCFGMQAPSWFLRPLNWLISKENSCLVHSIENDLLFILQFTPQCLLGRKRRMPFVTWSCKQQIPYHFLCFHLSDQIYE